MVDGGVTGRPGEASQDPVNAAQAAWMETRIGVVAVTYVDCRTAATSQSTSVVTGSAETGDADFRSYFVPSWPGAITAKSPEP